MIFISFSRTLFFFFLLTLRLNEKGAAAQFSVGAGVVQRGGVATITITSTSNILGVLVSAKIAGSFAGSFVTTTTIKQQVTKFST